MDRYTKPEFDKSALIVIDAQNDFLYKEPFELLGTAGILPALSRLVKLFRANGKPIIHMVRMYLADGGNADLCRKAKIEDGSCIATPGSDGSQIPPDLLPDPDIRLDADNLRAGRIQEIGPGEIVIYKPRWGAFYRTPLEEHLKSLGVSTLVFAGCNYPNCPRASIYEASERDFRIVLAEDAISGLYERGEEEMAGIGVTLMNVDEITEALAG